MEPHRRNRILQTTTTAVVVELVLAVVGWRSPAVASLTRLAMVIVAVSYAVAIWQASRSRSGEDRRHEDRRDH